MTFQELVLALESYWAKCGCAILQPYDVELGAGTMNPATFLRVLGPSPGTSRTWNPPAAPPMVGTERTRIASSTTISIR